jgi:hypothetical protein
VEAEYAVMLSNHSGRNLIWQSTTKISYVTQQDRDEMDFMQLMAKAKGDDDEDDDYEAAELCSYWKMATSEEDDDKEGDKNCAQHVAWQALAAGEDYAFWRAVEERTNDHTKLLTSATILRFPACQWYRLGFALQIWPHRRSIVWPLPNKACYTVAPAKLKLLGCCTTTCM